MFLLAKEAEKSNAELDMKDVQFLAEKLVCFIDSQESIGAKIDAQQVADSLVRLMPCIKMVVTN